MRGEPSPSGYPLLPSLLPSVGHEASREDRDSCVLALRVFEGVVGPQGVDQHKVWTEKLTVSGISLPTAHNSGVWAAGQRNLCRWVEAAILVMADVHPKDQDA